MQFIRGAFSLNSLPAVAGNGTRREVRVVSLTDLQFDIAVPYLYI